MRIAINAWFAGQDTTGSGHYTDRLLEDLPRVAPEHQIVAIRPPGARPGGDLRKVWFEQVGFRRQAAHADVAHVPYWGSPLRPPVPTVVTVHDLIPLLLPAYRRGWRVRAYIRLVSAAARRADIVLTDSQASAADIIGLLRIPADRVRPIYLAADAHFRPAPPESVSEVRARLGLPPRYILYLGGFDVRKRVPELVRAFAALASDLPDVDLVVAGRLPPVDSAMFPDPRATARALGIERRVHFAGWVEQADKPALYSGALAFVFPSEYEGFGLPPLEAMSCGCPVVATASSSLPEIVGDGGILVAPGSEAGLARALRAIAIDAGLREALADKAIAQAARFSWDKTARETVRAYDDAARSRRG